MAQIFVDDDTDMDLHKINITCEHLIKEGLKNFYEGEGFFKSQDVIFKKTITFKEKGEVYDIKIMHRDIKFEINDFEPKKIDKETFSPAMQILETFSSQTREYSKSIHNEWVLNLAEFIEEFLQNRMEIVIKNFEEQFKDEKEFKSVILNHLATLTNTLSKFCSSIRLCSKKCRKCERICEDYLHHDGDCDCKTGHRCEEICDRNKSCMENKYLCLELYGHDGNHRCGEGRHMCDHYCEIGEEISKCGNLCSYEAGHREPSLHNCCNMHPCPKKCQDEKCSRSCKFDMLSEHKIHECGETKCIHKCILCDSPCVFQNHLHDQLIKEGDESKLFHFDEGEKYLLNYHICDKVHHCGQYKKKKCEQKGVCIIDFEIVSKTWKTEFGSEFEYPYYKPKESRSFCAITIPKYMQDHKNPHKCGLETPHRCYQQCPECNSFCKLEIDHDGLHSTNTHRNKENSVFVTSTGKEKLQIKLDGKCHEFKVGERCEPENCSTSCLRKGRAHFHLKECSGEGKCDAKIHSFVKHSFDRFYPFEDKIFDLWLCKEYWNSLNWDPPVDVPENGLCSYICGHYDHKEDHSFCSLKAFHEGEHKFSCKHEETYSSSLLDIVFCVDTTGSMGPYIKESKSTIKKIISLAMSKGKDVNFGFVAYRDHPPQDKSYVTRCQNLCKEAEIQLFIEGVTDAGGGDGPEAVLDGLHDSIYKTSWREGASRYIFHIADAPPHGTEYTGGTGDGFPGGCPCGIKIETLAEEIKRKKIKYKLLKIGTYTNTMASIFKSKIIGYEESDLNGAVQLEAKISEIMVRDLSIKDSDYYGK